MSAQSRPTFDAAHLDARLDKLELTTQEAAEFLRVPPATMAAWRSGKKEPDNHDRIQLRLFMDVGRTHPVEMLIAHHRSRTVRNWESDGARHSGVAAPGYAGGYTGKDGVRVATTPPPVLRPSSIPPMRDVGPVKK